MPQSFTVFGDSELYISDKISVVDTNKSLAVDAQNLKNKKATLKLLNVFPIKEITVNKSPKLMVVAGGIPFGIKMNNSGVLITSLVNVETKDKSVCPIKNANIKPSDVILKINGKNVEDSLDVISKVNKCNGEKISITVLSTNGETKTVSVTPALDKNTKSYKIGAAIRDSSAGIGTLTYYNPQNKTFGGLGHSVTDADTGVNINLKNGEILCAEITGVIKGKNGCAGRLVGSFVNNTYSGEILKADDTGVYGTIFNVSYKDNPIEVASKQEIECGRATILTTVDGISPKEYNIEIERVFLNEQRNTKNMVIKITDKTLLNLTGGIVQGMSGSPILQNGKLVGAVTHVFVNDSTRGYAIFAENMLETAQNLTTEQLNKAS